MSKMNNMIIGTCPGTIDAEKAAKDAMDKAFGKDKDVEAIDIDYLICDVLIIKAESLKNRKIFGYADYLEKQLMKIKRKEAVLQL